MDNILNKKMKKILHIVSIMNRGGLETWLMNVIRNINLDEYRIDIAVQQAEQGEYDDELRSLGINIIPCIWNKNPISFVKKFFKLIRNNGPYDVIHCHLYRFSGFVLFLSFLMQIPVRIAHSHTSTDVNKDRRYFYNRCYHLLMRLLLYLFMTYGIAVSKLAAASLFGKKWCFDKRIKIIHCGLDFEKYRESYDKRARNEFGIPEKAFVVTHIGRFTPVKNHKFILKIAQILINQSEDIWFCFVGDGPLFERIRCIATSKGINGRATFTGSRADIPNILKNISDCLVFPSLYEGLGLAVIEAQAAGKPCIISDSIPKEADIISELIFRLSLDSPMTWAKRILFLKELKDISHNSLKNTIKSPTEVVLKSKFTIGACLKALLPLYVVKH